MSREFKKQHHKEEEKKLKKLILEHRKLWEARSNLGWIELDKPVQRGFERIVVPRADYLKRNDKNYFIELADIVQHTITCNDKKFIRKNWKTGKKEELHATPKELREDEYKKVPQKFLEEFTKEARKGHSWGTYSSTYTVYVLKKQWRFTEKTQKHFTTKIKLIDPDIDRRMAEIDHYLETSGLEYKAWLLFGSNKKSAWEVYDERRQYDAEKRVALEDARREIIDYSIKSI